MANLLRDKQVILSAAGKSYTIEKFLGAGTQGEVYKATVGGKPVAIKWYYLENLPRTKEDQYYNIERLVRAGTPNKNFLWPIDLCSAPDVQGFGYVMPLRESRYKPITDWMYRKPDVNPTFSALLTAGYNLAESFYDLHARGMCYRDINFGSVFFDPNTGDVAICDNDNAAVGPEGSLVLGTPDFMAPEVVRRETQPNTESDLHSLAVLLFYIFFISHPLYGRQVLKIHCMDTAAKNMLCGKIPVFIFDPQDRSNEAVPEAEDELREAGANAINFWQNIYPEYFKSFFTRSFTEGLRNPGLRVRETEWKAAMIKTRALLAKCPHCKVENFYTPDRIVNGTQTCWNCHKGFTTPPRIRLTQNGQAKNLIVLQPGTVLYPHHLDPDKPYDFTLPFAQVVQHPDTGMLGLLNMSGQPWTGSLNGKDKPVDNGKVLPLLNGMHAEFGKTTGEVRT